MPQDSENQTIDQLNHEAGLAYHDMQKLHGKVKKLNKERRTAAKQKEVIEEMSDITLLAVTLDGKLREHPDFATSAAKEDPFLPKIEAEAAALRETMTRVFKDLTDSDDESDAETGTKSRYKKSAAKIITDPHEDTQRFVARVNMFVKSLDKDKSRLKNPVAASP